MAWLAVDKNEEEYIYELKPNREAEVWYTDGSYIQLPQCTIRKILGKSLTWYDEPVNIE